MVYLKLLLTAFFWGGTFIAGRVISRLADPYIAAFFRFSIASVVLMVMIKWQMGKFPKLNLKQGLTMVALGMSGVFAYNIFFFSGLQTVTAGRASLIVALNPIAISLASSLLFKENLSVTKLCGIVLSVFGAMVVITRGDLAIIFEDAIGPGELAIFGCVVSWATYSLIGKKVMSGLSPLVSVGYSCLAGAALLFFPALSRGLLREWTVYGYQQWLSLFYLGIFGTVLGFAWYYQGIKLVGAMKASVFINFVPVSAIILAFLILNEPVTISLLIGAGLVISGVLLTNFSTVLLNRLKSMDRLILRK